MNAAFFGRGTARALLATPWAFPDVPTTIAFLWMLNPTFGVANVFARWLPWVHDNPQWLNSEKLALGCVIVITVWKGFPFYGLVILAALQTVDGTLYEAARVDGASPWGRFRYVTIPAILPTLSLLAILSSIFAIQQFTLIYLTTGGGPVTATSTLAINIYQQAFRFYDFSYASTVAAAGVATSALAVVLFILSRSRPASGSSHERRDPGRNGRRGAHLRRRRRSRGFRYWLGRVGLYVGVVVVLIVVFFPIYWMVVSSIQPLHYALHFPPPLYPKALNLDTYRQLIHDRPIGTWIWNSTKLALMTTVVTIVLATSGAYAMSRLRWHGKLAFGFMLLLTQMMPGAVIVVPVFKIYRESGLTGHLWAVALLHAAFILPIGVWILMRLFSALPEDVLDAARVDGSGDLGRALAHRLAALDARHRRGGRGRVLLQLERVPLHLDADHGHQLDTRVRRHRHAHLTARQSGAAAARGGHHVRDPAGAVLPLRAAADRRRA